MAKANKHGGSIASIYFDDVDTLNRIQALALKCELSTSALVDQLFKSVLGVLEEKAPVSREFELRVKVKL